MNAIVQSRSAGVPPGILVSAAALVAFALGAVLIGRGLDVGDTHMPQLQAYQVLQLRFLDRDNGAVAVQNAATNASLYTIAPGTNGFLRSALRGFAQERLRDGVGSAAPFTLTRWSDGTLSLEDKAIGRRIDLDAFGHTQAEAFAQLFTAKEAVK